LNRVKSVLIPYDLDEEKKRTAIISLFMALVISIGLILYLVNKVLSYHFYFYFNLAAAIYFLLLSIFLVLSLAAIIAHDIKARHFPLGENLLLAQTLKSVRDAITITDNNDDVVFVNEAFLSAYGYSENEIIGKKISIVRPLDTTNYLAQHIHEETLKGGWHGEVLNHRKNGEQFMVELWTSVVRDKDGNKVGTVGVAHDISDRKRVEIELIDAKEKAEEMSRLKSNFLSNMSHELRTPLVGILGFAEILENELTDNSHKEMITKIAMGAGRLSMTLNQILDLSKIETNTNSIEWAKIDLSFVIFEVIKLYTIPALKNNICIKSTFGQPDMIISGDERMLFSIFNNLVNNAVKYTSGGEISIDSFVETNVSGEYIVVKVADTGIGIPEDKLEIIFEEFRQVSEGFSRGYEGTGLGLTICKKFINLLNGTIHVESQQGKGSTFTVKFPKYNDIS